jgi:2,4-dienoyl-CoA reductase-like NADH-dependent reductase (Old Yellow Enzyme family)
LSLTALPSGLFEPKRIGTLELKNRFIRSATSETMATEDGRVTDALVRLHTDLAKGGVGLAILGHSFVHPSGRASPRQTGLHNDDFIQDLKRLTSAVHGCKGRIFAQLNHAGSQTGVEGVQPVGPSAIPNPIYGRMAKALSREEIEEIVDWFAQAARRVREANFDGIHIHGANGYLISAFCSPYANKRNDEWGGDAERRGRFLFEVYAAVRSAVGSDLPVTLKMGVADIVWPGLSVEESSTRAKKLEEEGLDGIEISCGIMSSYVDNVRKYVAVGNRGALSDFLFHRLMREPGKQAYYLPFAERMRKSVEIPLILAGGLRSTDVMESLIQTGVVDFLAMARPFIREPDIVNQIAAGRQGLVDCTSCNICLERDGIYALKCWRRKRTDLVRVLIDRMIGRA